jgi:hypothetical protein
LAIGTVAVIALTRAARLSARAQSESWPPDADALYAPRAEVIRFLSLGHHEMAADLLAARANVYFGGQISAHGSQRWLEQTLTTAIDLDPHFHRLYLRAAAMLVYNGQAFSVETLLAANRILERGQKLFSDDWELPFQRGFNLLFELPKLAGEDDPRVPDWRQQGVDALRQSALLEGAPPWLANLAARMLTKQGSDELAIRHLERTFAVTGNEETRAEIARRLTELRGRARATELQDEVNRLGAEIQARYPYAPEAFSLVAGPRQFGDAVRADGTLP